MGNGAQAHFGAAVTSIVVTDGRVREVTHSGITLGAVTGRVLAQEIMDGTVDPLMRPYRPGRFR